MYSNSLGNFYHPSEALVNEMKYPEGADLSQFVLKKPLVVNIGSIKGSIGDNQNGGAYPYRVVQQDSYLGSNLLQNKLHLLSIV